MASAYSVRVAMTVLVVARLAQAGPTDEARTHFDRGTVYYDLGKYTEAAKEYEVAFELAPRATLLFNIGQAYRLGGKPDRALAAYRGFLRRSSNDAAGSPAAALRGEAEGHIAALERLLEQAAAPPAMAARSAQPVARLPPITDKHVTWIEVGGETANRDKLQRCRALAVKEGWELWPAAPVQASINLARTGNQLQILVFRQPFASQPLGQDRMEDLCSDALRAIAATIAAKAVVLPSPPVDRTPPLESDLRTALGYKRAILDGCRQAYARDADKVAVEVTVGPSGGVTAVALPGIDLSGRFGNCLDRALKTLRLRAFKGEPVILRSTWSFSAPPAQPNRTVVDDE